MKKQIKLVESAKGITEQLLAFMLFEAPVSADYDKENEAILIDIQPSEKSGLLIGNKGRTLHAIQTVIGMILKNEVGEWQRVVVNVADWRSKEQERLESLAQQAAERAVSTGEEQILYNLNPSQRRVIHLVLSENKDISTESKGEGEERYMVITPKN